MGAGEEENDLGRIHLGSDMNREHEDLAAFLAALEKLERLLQEAPIVIADEGEAA